MARANKPENIFGRNFTRWNKEQKTPFTICEIARKTGYSRQSISSKLKGDYPMTVEEAILICNLTKAPFAKLAKDTSQAVMQAGQFEKCERGEMVRGRKALKK